VKALEIKGLTKLYKNNRGIIGINLEINQGDIFGFLGPNGAGKTTTMKAVTGLCKMDEGEIKIAGYDVNKQFEKAMTHVGCIIENCEAYDYMSAYKNLEMTARYHQGITSGRIGEVLELVGLHPYKNEKVSGFSLGMKQRLGLASAVLAKPTLLILDEPGNGLDIEGLVEIRNIIKTLAQEHKTTFLISSHQINEIQLLCNRIGIIREGRMLFNAYVDQLSKEVTLEDVYMECIKKEKVAS
jgi:ABC-2 type transport system ATP-binding protein